MCTSVLYRLVCALRDARAVVSRIRCFCHPAAEAARALIVRVIIHRGASLMNAGPFVPISLHFRLH